MAEQLLVAYKTDIAAFSLVPSDRGRFEVSLNGELIFSKLQEGRFPDDGEVKARLDARR
ncbi:MAG: SelT/SelW/SelH family protein [Gemmatimonadetes bacterium]|nr:SelT/SelW/SelH family protein [Gemmatimonadota bacterium]MXY80764.1 SelT/SelW/SelH family protein [Gemmatimonadota bacterium]MYA21258.1 SelT/SelW/SelH family protein [Gemmatimonadota bacterium]MYB70352.1 SelT/SelW/SelH family protein [Gemmatimonadota bacterium]